VSKAAEIVGDRWTLLVLRELLFGPLGFNEIARGLPGISRSILAQRLRRLTDLGIIEHGDQHDTGMPGYWLTRAGEQLGESVRSLGAWAAAWVMEDPSQTELDPDLLVLWISRHIDADALPTRRAVVAFDLRGPRSSRSWLVLEKPAGVSICHEDPRLDQRDYIYVQADTRALYRLYMGHLTLRDARDDGSVRLTGGGALVRTFSRWFKGSHFAPIVRATTAGGADDQFVARPIGADRSRSSSA
jgi:DNA-binding HxlR family transcriptional regulator